MIGIFLNRRVYDGSWLKCDSDSCISIATDAGVSRKTGPRNVRFATGEYGRVLERILPIDCLSSEHDLYWTVDEQEMFRQRARNQAKGYCAAVPHRVDALESVFSRCSEIELTPLNLRHDLQEICSWTTTNCRGLEHGVTRMFRREQRAVVRETVAYYRHLVESNTNGMYIDEDLEHFSAERTSRAREFAFKMALSDSLAI